MCSGTPRASATWMCPNGGGLAMIASAQKGRGSAASGSGAVHAGQQEVMISLTILVLAGSSVGCLASPMIEPPVVIIHWLSCFGSPASG